jgi:hypothetical protein
MVEALATFDRWGGGDMTMTDEELAVQAELRDAGRPHEPVDVRDELDRRSGAVGRHEGDPLPADAPTPTPAGADAPKPKRKR